MPRPRITPALAAFAVAGVITAGGAWAATSSPDRPTSPSTTSSSEVQREHAAEVEQERGVEAADDNTTSTLAGTGTTVGSTPTTAGTATTVGSTPTTGGTTATSVDDHRGRRSPGSSVVPPTTVGTSNRGPGSANSGPGTSGSSNVSGSSGSGSSGSGSSGGGHGSDNSGGDHHGGR